MVADSIGLHQAPTLKLNTPIEESSGKDLSDLFPRGLELGRLMVAVLVEWV